MIREEVIKKLDMIYPNIPIYGDEIPQGFKQPSFYVQVINGSHKKELNTRYKRTVSLDIQYFSELKEECEIKANELYEVMEYLIDNYAKGTNMRHETVDRVLHFFVDYNLSLIRQSDVVPKMNSLEVNEYGK